jgi:hypothetical protein
VVALNRELYIASSVASTVASNSGVISSSGNAVVERAVEKAMT